VKGKGCASKIGVGYLFVHMKYHETVQRQMSNRARREKKEEEGIRTGYFSLRLRRNLVERTRGQVDGLGVVARGALVGDSDHDRLAVVGVCDVDLLSAVRPAGVRLGFCRRVAVSS
jgi:hypothetical protein